MKYNILYGINPITEQLYTQLPDCLLATTKGNETLFGQTAINLDTLLAMPRTDIGKIIICSIYVDEIADSLLQHGVSAELIFFYNISTGEITNINVNARDPIRPDDILYVVYDLTKNVLCYDALSFAAVCEVERVKRGKKYLQFIIAPKNNSTGRRFYNSNYTEAECRWRLDNIVKPIFSAFESCIAISDMSFREDVPKLLAEHESFPAHFDLPAFDRSVGLVRLNAELEQGQQVPSVLIDQQARRLVEQFIRTQHANHKKIITFTFRGSATQEVRNTNIGPWLQFIKQLDFNEYLPVIVRDTAEATAQPLADCHAIEFPLACVSLPIRLALYDQAFINFGVATGPCFTYYFIKNCSSVRFVPINEQSFASSRSNLERTGFRIGELQPFQHNGIHQIIFEQETPELIAAAFQQQLQLLKEQGHV